MTGFPFGLLHPNIAGLYEQLIWAGDRLNGGFYGRAEGGLTTTTLLDHFAGSLRTGNQRWNSRCAKLARCAVPGTTYHDVVGCGWAGWLYTV